MTPATASRLRSLLSSLSSNRRLITTRFASSLSPPNPDPSVVCPRNRSEIVFEDQSDGGGSSAYNHAVRYSRPSTIKLGQQRSHLRNSISLIGTVELAPKAYNRRSGAEFGVYTLLSVKTSPDSNSSFRMLVEMWDEMAKVALDHIKIGDCVYVAGRLDSYRKKDSSGNERSEYKVIAKELNYVQLHDENQRSHEVQQSKDSKPQGGSSPKGKEDRLHLWQVFFSNPKEWHDWRVNKKTPRSPDFKHKSTGEALWMNADDPPWIKRQLELHDSMVAAGCFQDPNSNRRSASSYVSDDMV